MRVKDETKFLYRKKEQLNKELYNIHLQAASEWGTLWDTISNNIHESTHNTMDNKYKTIDQKLKRLTQNRETPDTHTHTFFPRVVNKTNISFSEEEENLLRKGLKYNLHQKPKSWVNTLAFEAETAVTLLPIQHQDPIRYQIARNIEQLKKQQELGQLKTPARFSNEMRIVRRIKAKLTDNKAIVTKADKGTSVVILYKTDYQAKVHHFINNNHFHIEPTNPTNRFRSEIRKTINSCASIIPKNMK